MWHAMQFKSLSQPPSDITDVVVIGDVPGVAGALQSVIAETSCVSSCISIVLGAPAKLYLSTILTNDCLLHVDGALKSSRRANPNSTLHSCKEAPMKSLICTGGIALAFALASIGGADAQQQRKMTYQAAFAKCK